jgi:hypothetical protein
MAADWNPKDKRITLEMDNFKTHIASTFTRYLNLEKLKGCGTGLSLFVRPRTEAG